MIKSIIKGIGIVIGIFIGMWLLSKVSLFGFGGSIKEILISFGEMIRDFGESLIKIGLK